MGQWAPLRRFHFQSLHHRYPRLQLSAGAGTLSIGKGRSDTAFNAVSLAQKAGDALDQLIPDQNRDKHVARIFGVSVRMAQYLRCGKCWTVERLSVACAVFGDEFAKLVWGLVPQPPPLDEMLRRFDRLEQQLENLLSEVRRGRNWTTSDDCACESSSLLSQQTSGSLEPANDSWCPGSPSHERVTDPEQVQISPNGSGRRRWPRVRPE